MVAVPVTGYGKNPSVYKEHSAGPLTSTAQDADPRARVEVGGVQRYRDGPEA